MTSRPQPPSKITTVQTETEEKNIAVVKEYMSIAYSPADNKGRESVQHLCTSDATFTAPTTFPDCNTPLDYADSHSKVMSAIADLHIVSYDVIFAKDAHVLLRYSAEGSHCGKPHNGIEATGRKAKWTASAIFEVEDGKVKSFTKEWDKLNMWKQLGLDGGHSGIFISQKSYARSTTGNNGAWRDLDSGASMDQHDCFTNVRARCPRRYPTKNLYMSPKASHHSCFYISSST